MGPPKFIIIIHCQSFQGVKTTPPCHEGGKHLRITHLLHITPCIKLLNEVIKFNSVNYIEESMWPLGGSIHFVHIFEQWGNKCYTSAIDPSKFDPNSPKDIDNVGGQNCTLGTCKPTNIACVKKIMSSKVHGIFLMPTKLITLGTQN